MQTPTCVWCSEPSGFGDVWRRLYFGSSLSSQLSASGHAQSLGKFPPKKILIHFSTLAAISFQAPPSLTNLHTIFTALFCWGCFLRVQLCLRFYFFWARSSPAASRRGRHPGVRLTSFMWAQALAGVLLVLVTSGDSFLILPSVFIFFSVWEFFFNGDSLGICRAPLHLPTDEDVSTPSLALLELW